MAVGIFDSGLGGLTVLEAAQRRLPDVDFIYLADSEHAPYGVRTADDIYDLTCKAVQRLFDAGCDLVILACNTASAAALRRMQEGWIPEGKRVLGVFVPLIEALIRSDQTRPDQIRYRTRPDQIGRHHRQERHACCAYGTCYVWRAMDTCGWLLLWHLLTSGNWQNCAPCESPSLMMAGLALA